MYKSLKRCHSHTLDSCKVFLLLLDNILRETSDAVDKGTFSHSGTNLSQNKSAIEKQGLISVRQSFQQLTSEVLPDIQAFLVTCSSQHINQKGFSSSRILKSVYQSTLMPHYNPKVCEFLACKLMEALSDGDKYIALLDMFVSKFYSLIVRVPSRPYSQCSTVDPLLMKCKFIVKCSEVGKALFKVVVLRSGFDHLQAGEESKEKYNVRSSTQITAILLHKRRVVESFGEICSHSGINVLLCTENVPSFAAEILQRKGISVIAFALEEEVDTLELLSGKVSLNSVNDEITNTNIIPLKGIVELIIGGQRYLQLQMTKLPWKHLVLCAPTVGLCDQLAMMCQKALKAVRFCYPSSTIMRSKEKVRNVDYTIQVENKEDELSFIPGGGTLELLMSSKLETFSQNCSNPNLTAMCNIFRKSLIDVVKVLFRNTSMMGDSNRDFLETLTVIEEQLKTAGESWGIDRRGRACNMAEKGVYEPVCGKLHVINCVLDLVDQLLRIDKIVSVGKTIQDSSSDSEEEEESSL